MSLGGNMSVCVCVSIVLQNLKRGNEGRGGAIVEFFFLFHVYPNISFHYLLRRCMYVSGFLLVLLCSPFCLFLFPFLLLLSLLLQKDMGKTIYIILGQNFLKLFNYILCHFSIKVGHV